MHPFFRFFQRCALPNKAMRSFGYSVDFNRQVDSLTAEEKRKFPPLCPDFVIELLFESDGLVQTKKKMDEWMENGCRLAWLIDPFEKKVYIYKSFMKVRVYEGFEASISGEDFLPGFELPLNELDD